MYQFQQKLKYFKDTIKRWNREFFGNIFEERSKLESLMKTVQQEAMDSGYIEDLLLDREIQLKTEINLKEKQEEIYGGKNPGTSGLRKEKEIPNSSTGNPSSTGRVTECKGFDKKTITWWKHNKIWNSA